MFAQNIVVFVITLFTLSKCNEVPDHFEEMAQELREVCMEESGVSLEKLDLVMKGQFPDDRALKCYFKCQFETYHLFTEDDIVDSSTVLGFFPPDLQDKYKHIFENCFDIKGADRCETAFLTHLCYHKADPELYFIL